MARTSRRPRRIRKPLTEKQIRAASRAYWAPIRRVLEKYDKSETSGDTPGKAKSSRPRAGPMKRRKKLPTIAQILKHHPERIREMNRAMIPGLDKVLKKYGIE